MQDICREVEPPLEEKEPRHLAACHFPLARGEVEQIIETPDAREPAETRA